MRNPEVGNLGLGTVVPDVISVLGSFSFSFPSRLACGFQLHFALWLKKMTAPPPVRLSKAKTF